MSRPKHLQRRWRYLAVEIERWAGTDLDRRGFQEACWEAARSLLGDAGSASLDLQVVAFAFTEGDGSAIVRTPVDGVERARAALVCIDTVDGQPLGLRIAGVSGTIRACREHQVPERSGTRNRATVTFSGEHRDACQRGERLDLRIGGSFVGATEREIE